MKSLILDETLDLSSRLRPLLMGRGCSVQYVCSIQELELVVNRHEPPDLMIVNLAGDLTPWQITRYLESTPAVRATLILVDRRPAAGLDVLASFPGVECAERDDMVRVNAPTTPS